MHKLEAVLATIVVLVIDFVIYMDGSIIFHVQRVFLDIVEHIANIG